MLKLLLDEHVSPAVAEGLRRRNRRLVVPCLAEWESGAFLGQPDLACLLAAATQGLTLVPYDRRTIPLLLKTWGEENRKQGGVIFVEKTISVPDIGGLVNALTDLAKKTAVWDWTNRVCFPRVDSFPGFTRAAQVRTQLARAEIALRPFATVTPKL